MRKLLLSLLTIIFIISLVGVASAQAPDSVSIGKLYVLQSEWIDLHTNPSLLAPIATKIPQGFIVRVVAGPQEVDGVNWWYITTSNYGWIPELIDDSPTLELFSTDLLEQTITEATTTLASDPQSIPALFQRAMAYYGLGDYPASLADFDTAIALDSRAAYLYGWRGLVDLDSYLYYEAEADFFKARSLDPTEAMYFIRRGVALENLNRMYDAEYDYLQASELVPTYAVPINNIGNLRRYEGSYLLATNQYEKAMALDPHYGRPYYNRALVKRDQGDYIGALDDFGQALAIDPYDASAYYMRGNFLDDNFGNMGAAINDFTNAIELNEYYAEAYIGRGIAYARLQNYELAIADFRRAAEIGSPNGDADYNLGAAYAHIGLFEESLESYSRAMEASQAWYESGRVYRGQVLIALGRYNEAIDDFTTYMTIGTTNSNDYYLDLIAHIMRASAYAYLGNFELAATDLEYAYYRDYQFTVSFDYTSGYKIVEDQGGRVLVVQDALEQNPNDASLYLQIANIYLEANRWENALDYYQQYVALAGSDQDNIGRLIEVLQTITQ